MASCTKHHILNKFRLLYVNIFPLKQDPPPNNPQQKGPANGLLFRGLAAAKHGAEHGLEPPAAAEAALRAAGHETKRLPKQGVGGRKLHATTRGPTNLLRPYKIGEITPLMTEKNSYHFL